MATDSQIYPGVFVPGVAPVRSEPAILTDERDMPQWNLCDRGRHNTKCSRVRPGVGVTTRIRDTHVG